jgi:hypothetical protein
MNERQAFGWAVRSLRLYDWKSDQPRFQVNGDSLTIRELCERAKKLDEPLPEVIKYDLYPILGGATDLQAKLRLSETYSVAATCLLARLRALRLARDAGQDVVLEKPTEVSTATKRSACLHFCGPSHVVSRLSYFAQIPGG